MYSTCTGTGNCYFYFILGDLENLLKKLSLEKYQPIFEEQEVCNEQYRHL